MYRIKFDTLATPSMESIAYSFLIQLNKSQGESGEIALEWARHEGEEDDPDDMRLGAHLMRNGSDCFYSPQTFWTLVLEETAMSRYTIEVVYFPRTHTWTLGFVHQACCETINFATCNFSVVKVPREEVPECVTA